MNNEYNIQTVSKSKSGFDQYKKWSNVLTKNIKKALNRIG